MPQVPFFSWKITPLEYSAFQCYVVAPNSSRTASISALCSASQRKRLFTPAHGHSQITSLHRRRAIRVIVTIVVETPLFHRQPSCIQIKFEVIDKVNKLLGSETNAYRDTPRRRDSLLITQHLHPQNRAYYTRKQITSSRKLACPLKYTLINHAASTGYECLQFARTLLPSRGYIPCITNNWRLRAYQLAARSQLMRAIIISPS